MVKSKRLPEEFWEKTVTGAVYLSNRTPTRSVCRKHHKKYGSLTFLHLRFFGSIAHVHVPNEKRKKFDDNSKSTL